MSHNIGSVNPESQRAKNVERFTALPTQELVSWLRRGLDGAGFAPLVLGSDPTRSYQVQNLFSDLQPDQQERLKSASVQALGEWVYGIHSTDLLKELAIVTAYIGAGSAVDQIRVQLEYLRPEALDAVEYRDVVGTLIAVAQGFAPLIQVRHLFRSLFAKNEYDQFAAQLFLGLCQCDPTEYPEYLPTFLSIYNRLDGMFSPAIVWAEFVRIVSVPGIVDGSNRLDREHWGQLYNLLTDYEWSPLRWVTGPRRILQLVVRHDWQRSVVLPAGAIPGGSDAFRAVYRTQVREFDSHGGSIETLIERSAS